MKYLIYFSVLIALATITVSCEKVIDLNLDADEQKVVIEGFVTKGETEHTVTVTRTLEFDQDQAFPTVDDATVIISDNAGNSEALQFVGSGVYKTTTLLGVEGRTYTITVQVDGETFTASSYLPFQVPLDSLTVQEFPFGPTPVIALTANRMDPAGIINFYQFDLFKGSERVNGIYIQDDQVSDGVEQLQPISFGDFESGDTATVIMYCIDEPVYKYFFALDANGGGTGGATPANPVSNFGTKCLGYFSARTQEAKTLVIP